MFNIFQSDSKKYRSVWISNPKNRTVDLAKLSHIQAERINVAPQLKAIINQLMPLAKSKNIDLELRLCCDELFAETHDDCFCLMVYNLIGHSLKDAPINGRVTVDAYTEGLDFVLEVMHNGKAFTTEEVSFAFNLGQVERSSSHPMLIPGAGLDSVKQIVDAHKGQLIAECREGRGAAYTVRLHMIGDVYI